MTAHTRNLPRTTTHTVDINEPGRPRTFCQDRVTGGYTLGQGQNRITISNGEARRLVAAMEAGIVPDNLRYTTTTPERITP